MAQRITLTFSTGVVFSEEEHYGILDGLSKPEIEELFQRLRASKDYKADGSLNLASLIDEGNPKYLPTVCQHLLTMVKSFLPEAEEVEKPKAKPKARKATPPKNTLVEIKSPALPDASSSQVLPDSKNS